MPNPAFHELIDHTSEVQLRLRADSLGGLLAEAGRALAELQLRGAEAGTTTGPRRIHVAAADRESLLVDWLNELIFQAETERWVATGFVIEQVTGRSIDATATGVELARISGLVKAATLHGLRVAEADGWWEGEVILDV